MHWHRHIDTRGTPYTISSDLWLELVCWDGIHAPRMLVLRWKPGVVLIYTHRGVYPVGAMHKIPYLHLFTKSRTPMTCGMTYNQRKWLFTMVRNPMLGGGRIRCWGGQSSMTHFGTFENLFSWNGELLGIYGLGVSCWIFNKTISGEIRADT